MPNELPLHPQWQHLIEKRSNGDRRRSATANSADSDATGQTHVPYTGPERRKRKRRKDDR